jgi:hypothetical protein
MGDPQVTMIVSILKCCYDLGDWGKPHHDWEKLHILEMVEGLGNLGITRNFTNKLWGRHLGM